LNGQFAFASLDLHKGRLLLARDLFGIKPLYLAESPEGTWFASEVSALLAAGIVPHARREGWPTVVNWTYYRGTETLIDGVSRLRPGAYIDLPIDNSRPINVRWDSAARHVSTSRQSALQDCSRAVLVSKLTDTLRTSVHDALMSDVPVGTFCSGGVDSAVITALATEKMPNLVAFSASLAGHRTHDESAAARMVANHLDIDLDVMEVTKDHWRSGFVEATVHFQSPIATASSVTISQMAERARRRGIKVVLTGEGADELFGGYSNPFSGPLRQFLRRRDLAWRLLEPRLFGRLVPSSAGVLNHARRILRTPTSESEPLPGDEPIFTLNEDPAVREEIRSAYSHHSGSRFDIEVGLLEDLHFTLAHLLNRMDANVMQASVEARVPFLDPRVVDLVVNLPLEARIAPWTKGILRDVARSLVPLRIAQRSKIYGMDYDAGRWIEEAATPGFLADGMLQEVFAISRPQFLDLIERAYPTLRVRLWSAEVWCRSVFGGDSTAAIETALWRAGP
jgi:asparagine synthase (glutamine-hydrolysing)